MKQHISIWLVPLIGGVLLLSACGGSQTTGAAGSTAPAGGPLGGAASSHVQITGTITGTLIQAAACVAGPIGLSVTIDGTLSDGKQYLFQAIAGPGTAGTFTAAQGAQATLTDLTAGGSFYGATTQTSDVTVMVDSGAKTGSVTATMPFFQDLTTPVPSKSVQASGTWHCE
jgi:hypothetical protein